MKLVTNLRKVRWFILTDAQAFAALDDFSVQVLRQSKALEKDASI